MKSNEVITKTKPKSHTYKSPATTRHARYSPQGKYPLTNIFRDDNMIRLELALPGVRKEEVNMKVANRILTVEVEPVSKENSQSEIRHLRREFGVRALSREFRLSDKIDSERISAELTNGVLVISMPHVVESDVTKTIDIH